MALHAEQETVLGFWSILSKQPVVVTGDMYYDKRKLWKIPTPLGPFISSKAAKRFMENLQPRTGQYYFIETFSEKHTRVTQPADELSYFAIYLMATERFRKKQERKDRERAKKPTKTMPDDPVQV